MTRHQHTDEIAADLERAGVSTDAPADQEQETTAAAIWRPLDQLPAPTAEERPIAYIGRLMDMLPPQTDDVIDSILGNILDAGTAAEENKLWDSTGSKDAVGNTYRFESVHISPSDYTDSPLPYFLICKVTNMDTGESGVLTTGSLNIVASLVKAQVLGNLPAIATINGPRRKSSNGRIPLHLIWARNYSGVVGGRVVSEQ